MATRRPLTAAALLNVWENALRQRPHDQALTILEVACPDVPRERLVALSVGRRDAALLTVRRETFGPALQSFVDCPGCGERLEFALAADAIGAEFVLDPGEPDGEVGGAFAMDGYAIRFRLPDSRDLGAVAGAGDVAAGRAILLRRCLLSSERDGVPVAADDLPEDVVAEVSRQMAERDPQAELLLDLNCPACAHNWEAPFDIVPFFWAEIATEAKRLLREVHTLARSYGWRETDVLAMSEMRRRSYLEVLDG